MIELLNLRKQVYATYAGDGERHWLRVSISIAVCLFVGLCAASVSKETVPTMAVVLSVLAGFSFTALFSNHSMSSGDLPPPKDENDRNDIRNLKVLGENFKIRSRFFIVCSVVDLLVMLALSINFPKENLWIAGNVIALIKDNVSISAAFFNMIAAFYPYFQSAIVAIAFFLFLECLYTFYRLSETIFAMLDTKRAYLDSHV